MRGVIAAGDPATAEAGAAALRAGGTATDAAVAAGFACFTAETLLATAGGAGALVARDPERGLWAFDFFVRAPGLGLAERPALDFGPVEVDFGATTQVFHVGRGAAAPPSAIAGLLEAHAALGHLPLPAVLAPAIRVACEGTTISAGVAYVVALLRPIATRSEAARRLYAPGGRLLSAGDRHANPELAAVIETVAATGEDPLTRGALGGRLVDEFGPGAGGLITGRDLAAYRPEVREPIAFEYRGRRVVTFPPPSTGGLLIRATLDRLAEVDRGGRFLSGAHLRAVAAALREVSIDRPRIESAGYTTHISVIDARGGAAALTLSSGECCGEVLSGTGIHLNNFLGEDDINPGGFHRHTAGEWMRTMMAPTLVLDERGDPVLALGSGGSNRLRSAIAQAVVNLLAFERPLAEAVRAPRVHVEGDRLWYERVDLGPDACDALEAGYPSPTRFPERNMYFGGVHAVARTSAGLVAAGDARRGGAAIVVE